MRLKWHQRCKFCTDDNLGNMRICDCEGDGLIRENPNFDQLCPPNSHLMLRNSQLIYLSLSHRSGSECSVSEETSDWPRSPVLPVYCDNWSHAAPRSRLVPYPFHLTSKGRMEVLGSSRTQRACAHVRPACKPSLNLQGKSCKLLYPAAFDWELHTR